MLSSSEMVMHPSGKMETLGEFVKSNSGGGGGSTVWQKIGNTYTGVKKPNQIEYTQDMLSVINGDDYNEILIEFVQNASRTVISMPLEMFVNKTVLKTCVTPNTGTGAEIANPITFQQILTDNAITKFSLIWGGSYYSSGFDVTFYAR